MRVKRVDVSSFFLGEATKLMVVDAAVFVDIHGVEDVVNVFLWKLHSQTFNAFVKLVSLDLLIIIIVK